LTADEGGLLDSVSQSAAKNGWRCANEGESNSFEISHLGGRMQNKLIAFVAVASVLIFAYFVYFVTRPSPCESIFEQTAPKLQVKLDNGAWAIGQE
jgi:hypothetical protein